MPDDTAATGSSESTPAASDGPLPSPNQTIFTDRERELLRSTQQEALRCSKGQGAYEEVLCSAMLALLGEGLVAPRLARSWARPNWCVGRCPGCSRELRLLVVPTLDVLQCLFCGAWM